MTQKHTPEPWGTRAGRIYQAEKVQHTVASVARDINDCAIFNDSDALRIVACVNACAGLPTEQLESSPPGGVLKGVAGLIAQRDELLAALEIIAASEEFHGDSFVCDFGTLQGVAGAAIAKTKGGAA